ncbi:MAG: TIGR03087 family PEP-CTERM/XrtA system glycosyltransferase, partial [Rubrivivax sp.]|nr:TIGR03087 family PEP-CTERM/XrtA system glycosyltransferase [Rubrivivax sp.]
MSNLLYLVHRLPYPPDKGDKVRSYHLLEHLRARHRVFVGTFVDDPADRAHLPALRERCAGLHAEPLDPRRAKVASLAGLVTGDPLTLRYYRSAALRRWVQATVREQSIDAVVVFSSSMAPYAEGLGLPVLVDLVDVDSAKWADYAPRHRWPLSWLYRREGERLLAYERDVVARAAHAFLVTDKEVALFEQLAPECRGRVEALGNGVDAEVFAPDPARVSPFAAGETPLVFTGAMDYWPNVDAVTWFAHEILPRLRERHPAARLHAVGRSPTPAVRALAGDAVAVSGTVPDVRPYLQHAAVVVAPLRL